VTIRSVTPVIEAWAWLTASSTATAVAVLLADVGHDAMHLRDLSLSGAEDDITVEVARRDVEC
jgi:hypothetical protein